MSPGGNGPFARKSSTAACLTSAERVLSLALVKCPNSQRWPLVTPVGGTSAQRRKRLRQ